MFPTLSTTDLSFTALYTQYAPYLTNYLTRHNRTLSPDTIEDIIHDVFYSIWIRRSTWHPASIPAYFTAAVKKCLIDHLRSRKWEEPLDLTTHHPAVPSLHGGMHSTTSTDSAHHHSEIEELVATSISRIPVPVDQAVTRHHFYEHLTPGTIVKILKIRNKAVREKITSAREHIAVDLFAAGVRAPLQKLNRQRTAAGISPLTRSPYEDTIDTITRMKRELERDPSITQTISTVWGPISLLGRYTSEEVAALQQITSEAYFRSL